MLEPCAVKDTRTVLILRFHFTDFFECGGVVLPPSLNKTLLSIGVAVLP